jgi:predicted DsbA family dithiol-disulfide isomerase
MLSMGADVDFFWDPMCPWAWIGSRWVADVADRRGLEVQWRFISLRLVNEGRDYDAEFPDGYLEHHDRSLRLLRVAARIRRDLNDKAVGYSAHSSTNSTATRSLIRSARPLCGTRSLVLAATRTG